MKLWQDILGTNMDLWAAYTQLSLWQFYNTEFSSPFRETNYEPEILLNYRTDTDIFGLMRSRFIQVGLNHQSNGRERAPLAELEPDRGELRLRAGAFSTSSSRPGPASPRATRTTTTRTSHPTWATGRSGLGTIWKDYHLGLMFRNNLRFDEKPQRPAARS